jgi:CIC family chloride channel protein
MLKYTLRRLRDLQNRLLQTGQIYMVLVAVVIGILGGLCAVGFRRLIQILNEVFWHEGEYTLAYISSLPPWWKILAPALGGLVTGYIIWRFAREAKGHGVPEVMEAVALRGGRIRPRVVIAKMFASGVSIASGGSVGREGPIVQIGSALGSAIGQWLRIDQRKLRTLVGCGAAAGIAGTFNAPVAGALFAVEIILGDFGVAQFSPIVISSVAATVISHHFLGDFPAFEVPVYNLVSAGELFAYAGLGTLAAVVAIGFIRALYATEDIFDRIRLFGPLKALLGGAMIGTIGLLFPQIFGVGYEAITEALNGNMLWWFMLILVAVKIVAVSITIGSGGSGGIFAPSLFIGAMLGGAVGTVVHMIWPESTGTAGAYSLVGMGAVVAAGTHAPITAILIIFELTSEYSIILPLMISCIIATLLATRLQGASIYTMKLLRRGIDIYRGRDINVLQPIPVREAMRTGMVTVSPGDGLSHLMSRFVEHSGSTIFVTGHDRTLHGIITAEQLRPIMKDAPSLEGLVIAGDVMVVGKLPTVSVDDSLADVMRQMGVYRGEVAVLKNTQLAGVIWPEDVIERYNTEIFKRDMARGVASAVDSDKAAATVHALVGAAVAEIPVPPGFVGKTIKELDIRRRYGVSVLMIKHEGAIDDQPVDAAADPDYVFQPGDVMLAMGAKEKLGKLRIG